MPTKFIDVRPPHGLTRLLMRFPIWLFCMHLGWMVGERFLLLTHTGRKSGLPRMMGYRLDGSEEDFRALAHLGIVVAFHPTIAVS